mgnify:CR=1 FL=1
MIVYKNTHEIKKSLLKEYGKENAKHLALVRNPYNKLLLEIQTPGGAVLSRYNQIPKMGWIKS